MTYIFDVIVSLGFKLFKFLLQSSLCPWLNFFNSSLAFHFIYCVQAVHKTLHPLCIFQETSMIAITTPEIWPYWNDCRSERRRRDSPAEREGLAHSDLRWHEGGVRSGVSLSHRKHTAPCWAPAALLPPAETLGRCGQPLHGHLLSESGWGRLGWHISLSVSVFWYERSKITMHTLQFNTHFYTI